MTYLGIAFEEARRGNTQARCMILRRGAKGLSMPWRAACFGKTHKKCDCNEKEERGG
jgi:hypothetical protein